MEGQQRLLASEVRSKKFLLIVMNIEQIIIHAVKWRDFILDLIFPVECLGCDREDVWLCAPCFQKLKVKTRQYCLHCKKKNKWGEFCPECRRNYFLDGCFIAGDYEDEILANLIKNFKYKFIRNLGVELGRFLFLSVRNLNSEAVDLSWHAKRHNFLFNLKNNLALAVPLARKRERWRGFNQAEILKRELIGGEVVVAGEKLVRIKHKKPQAKLGEEERKLNVKDCFAWQGENLRGRNVILVDDVVTTGATLNECARVLKESGSGKVWGLVVAKG